MNEHTHSDHGISQDTYQTGRTAPPKSYRGIIAFLLVLVIFLSGVSTALGLMNIRLFRQLSQSDTQETAALGFYPGEGSQSAAAVRFGQLGLSGEPVSVFWQEYLHLPQGLYITDVTEHAAKTGLQAGDILLRFRGTQVQTAQALQNLLSQCVCGEEAELEIYRDGQQKTLRITIENTTP